MNHPSCSVAALVALALFLLTGCGGGSAALPAGAGVPGPVSVSGVVIERDGETTDLGGIELLLIETGEGTMTDAEGAFDFASAQPGTMTLRVTALAGPAAALQAASLNDDPADELEDEFEDEFEDDDEDEREEGSDDGIRVEDVQAGESVRIRIRVAGGKIVEMRVSRSDRDEREVEIQMARAPGGDDPDLKGEVELESRSDREKFEVEVEHAEPGRELELIVIDPDGFEESQGIRAVDSLGEAEWEASTGDGQRLPFAVASVDDLVDYQVEVRDALSGLVLLSVNVPEVPASAPPSADGGSADDGADGDSGGATADVRARGRARLLPAVSGLEGYVEVRRRPDEGRERFQIEAERLAPGRVVEFFLEDPGLPDSFLSLGAFAADEAGEAELELDTNDGDLPPGGAASVRDLVDLRVEVRDAGSGALLLSGTVPALVAED